MAEYPSFVRKQYEFAAHIRNPARNPAPADIEDRRMGIYRELLYNNVEDFLANAFPVLREITEDERWHALVREYFSEHRAKTPLFPQMPTEFLAYLEHERAPRPEDPPFLLELAHYEWVELALSLSDAPVPWQEIDGDGDLLAGTPALSALALPLSYRFAVHRIGPDYQPREPEASPAYLVVYRDASDEIGFLEINPATFRLLQLLSRDHALSGHQALELVAAELQHPNPQAVLDGGKQVLEDLRQRGIVLGTRRR